MNNRRLSTNTSSTNDSELVDRGVLIAKVNKLLSGPSNFESNEEGEIFIKSLGRNYRQSTRFTLKMLDENGNLLKTWDSLMSCAG
jgi:hypothetical protein